MKERKGKKKWAVAAGTLAAMAMLAGSFAWFTSEDSAKNSFESELAGNDIEVVETFTPPTDWKPGQDVNKDVAVLNTGNYDSLMRVSFTEAFSKLANADTITGTDGAVLDGKTTGNTYLYPLSDTAFADGTWTDGVLSAAQSFTVASGDYAGTYSLKVKEQVTANGFKYVSYWENAAGDQYYAKAGTYSRDEATGALTLAASATFKYVDLKYDAEVLKDWTAPYAASFTFNADGTSTAISAADSNIKLNFVNLTETPTANNWYYNAVDGHFYFVGIVGAQEQTAQLLDSVELLDTADNSYSKMKYDLDINAKGIQANPEVIDSIDWANNTNSALSTALNALPFAN